MIFGEGVEGIVEGMPQLRDAVFGPGNPGRRHRVPGRRRELAVHPLLAIVPNTGPDITPQVIDTLSSFCTRHINE